MTKLRYTGSSDQYSLEAADLSRHGVEGFTDTVFDGNNQFTAEVNQDAADKLVELMPQQFEIVVDEAPTESTNTLELVDPPAGGDADGDASDDDSTGDQDAGEGSSKKGKSKGN